MHIFIVHTRLILVNNAHINATHFENGHSPSVFVTKPAKINHLSTIIADFLFLYYRNLMTVYTTTTKSLSLLDNLTDFLLQLTEMGYYIINRRY